MRSENTPCSYAEGRIANLPRSRPKSRSEERAMGVTAVVGRLGNGGCAGDRLVLEHLVNARLGDAELSNR